VLLRLLVLGPRGEVSHLPLPISAIVAIWLYGQTYIVAIIRHPHLGPDKKDLSIVDDHAAII
jgi:hypothetical protein